MPERSSRAPTASTQAIASGNDGTGVTVAVIDAYASPTAASDLATVLRRARPGRAEAHRAGGTRAPTSGPPNKKQDPAGWAGEETLDLEAVHTMAPGANILYVGAPNNYQDLDAALNKVVDSHIADIVTNSYGYGGEALPTGYIKPQLDAQIQAAATGISVFFSSGDDGDETGGVAGATPTPDWPASSPWVTAVGGTSLGVAQNNTRLFEVGWETAKSTLHLRGCLDHPGVPVRRWRRHVAAVRPAVVPGGCRPGLDRQDLRWRRHARRPGRRGPR